MNKKIFIVLTVLIICYWFLFDFLRWIQYDSPSFIGGARLMFGLDGGYDFQSRLTKPLALILPGLTEFLFKVSPAYIFFLQNIVLFYLCGFFIYKINKIIFKDEKIAFIGMLVYVTCQPFAIFSLFVMTDVCGWFFGILSIYLTLSVIQNRFFEEKKSLFIIGLMTGLGFLFKESSIIGLIFAFSYVIVNKTINKIRFRQIMYIMLGFIIPVLISFLLIENFFHDSVIKRIIYSHHSVANDEYKFSNVKQIYRIVDEYWFLFLIGIVSFVKNFKNINPVYKTFLLALLISFVLMPIWPYFNDRILFMTGPFILMFIISGVTKLKQFALPIVVIGGLINIMTAFIIYKYNPAGLLYFSSAVYLILLSVFWWFLYKKDSIRVLLQ